MNKIEVLYDGRYPNTCSGTLIIKIDDEKVYEERYCCGSSGSVWFSNNYAEAHVESGELTWNHDELTKFRKWFDKNASKKKWKPSLLSQVEEAVKERLSQCSVCCGGCI